MKKRINISRHWLVIEIADLPQLLVGSSFKVPARSSSLSNHLKIVMIARWSCLWEFYWESSTPSSSPPPSSPAQSWAAWQPLASAAGKNLDLDEGQDEEDDELLETPVSAFSSSLESWTSFSLAFGAHHGAPDQHFPSRSILAHSPTLHYHFGVHQFWYSHVKSPFQSSPPKSSIPS